MIDIWIDTLLINTSIYLVYMKYGVMLLTVAVRLSAVKF